MAQLLGNITVGNTVYLKENGNSQPYLIVHQGLPSGLYDESCNGTWLLRKNVYQNQAWNFGANNTFEGSNQLNFLKNSFLPILDNYIKSVIKTVKIPYCVGGGNATVNSGDSGYECQLFLLSDYELGFTTSDFSYLPIDGAKLDYFLSGNSASANEKRIAYLNSVKRAWWTRTPSKLSQSKIFYIDDDGTSTTLTSANTLGIRPAMIMPQNLLVDDSNNIMQIPSVSVLNSPSLAMVNQFIPLSWSSVIVSGFSTTYQLQRNINNGGWQNVGSPISQTSYTDTAQSGWTQVQYQVAPIIEENMGTYTQSSIIPVSDPSALVISGSDSNLGTLTSNVPYTVSSNTGNPISLTRTVNGAQVVTLTVESGFAYSIPIADLPTGTGTIQITASVESSSETVTQTRTWTYYKTPINIPSTGGIAQLTQNGQNIWPVTVPDAVEAPVYLGGNLNAALNKLGQAALYTKIGSPKYNQVTVDLSKVKVGDEVLLPYNDVMVPHIVVHIGNPNSGLYDSSCDGVWLLRKASMNLGKWNNTNINTFANSTIISAMQNYITNYDNEVQSAIKTIKIPYCVGGGNATVNSGANGYECQLFPLSCRELGITTGGGDSFPIDGAKLDYFISGTSSSANKLRIPFDESHKWYWTRSILSSFSKSVSFIDEDGDNLVGSANEDQYYRPAFIMPTTFNHTYYVGNNNSVYPAQEYTQGGSITDVFGYDVPICQYETGSYVGTGTYGSSNPNSLTFGFVPKFVCIEEIGSIPVQAFFIYNASYTRNTNSTSSNSDIKVTWDSNTLSWYSGSSSSQLNDNSRTYYYIAIG